MSVIGYPTPPPSPLPTVRGGGARVPPLRFTERGLGGEVVKPPYTLLLFLFAVSISIHRAYPQSNAVSPATSEAFVQAVEEILGYVERQDWKKVAEMTEPLRKENPDSPELLLFDAAAAHGLGRHSICEEHSRAFLNRFPDSLNRDQALFLLGSSLFQMNRRKESASVLSDASTTTADPRLQARIGFLEKLLQAPQKARIGIQLGGKPPEGEAEIERARQVGLRVLEMAVEDFRTVHGQYPENLERLLEGSPPILKALPEDPAHPGRALAFCIESSSPSTVSPDPPASP